MNDDEACDCSDCTEAEWPWRWFCVLTAVAMGVRTTVNSLTTDLIAAHNHRIEQSLRKEADVLFIDMTSRG